MGLIYRIITRLSFILLVLLTAWAVFFYATVMEEVTDEIDDNLDELSEQIIVRALTGDTITNAIVGTNNSYFITNISEDYARSHVAILYSDEMIYIESKKETEPARILKTIYHDKDNNWYELTVSTPTIEKKDLITSIANWIITLYIILLISILIVNILVYNRSMRPLYKLLNWLDNYTIGVDNEPLVNDTTITEFKKLNEAAINNTERIKKAYELQKQFIGNASHEIQTPLAICQNRLELLMDSENLTENQLGEIYKTINTISSLSKMNKSLLLLTKIDNRQFHDNKLLNISEIINNVLDDFSLAYSYKNISVTFSNNDIIKFKMDESLCVTLFSNLLKNAFYHNIDNGEIIIDIGSNYVSIGNSGPLVPLDSNRIFDRFYQGAKKEGSTGLGLAISKAICEMYNLTLSYSYSLNKHYFIISE